MDQPIFSRESTPCFISPLLCPFSLTHIGKFLLLLNLRPPPFWLQSLNLSLKAPRL